MKTLQEYTSLELYNELQRREENLEYLEISTNSKKIDNKEFVIVYGTNLFGETKYATHLEDEEGTIEFYYNYESAKGLLPSCFYDTEEGIFQSTYDLNKSLDILKKCNISHYRDDTFFEN